MHMKYLPKMIGFALTTCSLKSKGLRKDYNVVIILESCMFICFEIS